MAGILKCLREVIAALIEDETLGEETKRKLRKVDKTIVQARAEMSYNAPSFVHYSPQPQSVPEFQE
jgi:hypothetical protein